MGHTGRTLTQAVDLEAASLGPEALNLRDPKRCAHEVISKANIVGNGAMVLRPDETYFQKEKNQEFCKLQAGEVDTNPQQNEKNIFLNK